MGGWGGGERRRLEGGEGREEKGGGALGGATKCGWPGRPCAPAPSPRPSPPRPWPPGVHVYLIHSARRARGLTFYF
jgi:hypothetical protein